MTGATAVGLYPSTAKTIWVRGQSPDPVSSASRPFPSVVSWWVPLNGIVTTGLGNQGDAPNIQAPYPNNYTESARNTTYYFHHFLEPIDKVAFLLYNVYRYT